MKLKICYKLLTQNNTLTEPITIADWIGESINYTSVLLGETLELKCTANGNPIPSIVWWKDNLPVEDQTALPHDVQLIVENCSALSTLRIFDMWYTNIL